MSWSVAQCARARLEFFRVALFCIVVHCAAVGCSVLQSAAEW